MDDLFLLEKMTSSLQPLANPQFESLPRILQTDVQNVSFSKNLASSPQVFVYPNLGSQEVSESVNGDFSVQDMKLSSLNSPENKPLYSSGTPEAPSTSEYNSNMFLSLQKFVQLMKLPEKQPLGLPEISNDDSNGMSPNQPDSSLQSTESQPPSLPEILKNDGNGLPTNTPDSPLQSIECLTQDSFEYSKFESDGFVLQRNDFDDILTFYSKVYKMCKCDDCGKSFQSDEELDKHWENHQCGLSNKSLRTRDYWEQYFKNDCSKGPLSVLERKTPHVPTNHNGRHGLIIRKGQKASCHICGKILCDVSSLKQHLRIHTGERPYACHLCDKTFPYSSSLKSHIHGHNNIKTHFCELCNKGFVSKANVRIHMVVHTGEKNFLCDICAKTFSQINILNQHKRRKHSDERPYKCHLCSRDFKVKENLNCHLLSHSDERPFKCDKCDSRFKNKNGLRRHRYLHSEVKPHNCSTCGKGFNQRTLLVRHFKIHPEVEL